MDARARRAHAEIAMQMIRQGDIDCVDVSAGKALIVLCIGVCLLDPVLARELLPLHRIIGHQGRQL